MEEVEETLWKLVVEVGHIVAAADDVVQVTAALQNLASLLQITKIEGQDPGDSKSASLTPSLKTLDEISILCREKASEAFPTSPPEEVLSRAFYSGPYFAATAQLLRKVAVDWLACFSLQEQTTLFHNFFTRAPLSEALSALVLGLSVNDVSEDEEGDFAAGNLSAACAQSERLLVLLFISGKGVKKLALSLSSPKEALPESTPSRGGVLASRSHKNSQLAQLLSSIPDRASLQAPTALQSPYPPIESLRLKVSAFVL